MIFRRQNYFINLKNRIQESDIQLLTYLKIRYFLRFFRSLTYYILIFFGHPKKCIFLTCRMI